MSISNGFALLERAKDINATYYNELCLHDPSLAVCEFVPSFYGYRIQLAPNAAFLAIFSLSFIAFVVTYIVTRRGLAFNIALLLGLLCEIIGYAGRIMSWQNQWEMNGFLIQIICLTIGPAFMSAGIYLCLRRIVYAFGPENSRIQPEWYTRLVSRTNSLFSSVLLSSCSLSLSFFLSLRAAGRSPATSPGRNAMANQGRNH